MILCPSLHRVPLTRRAFDQSFQELNRHRGTTFLVPSPCIYYLDFGHFLAHLKAICKHLIPYMRLSDHYLVYDNQKILLKLFVSKK